MPAAAFGAPPVPLVLVLVPALVPVLAPVLETALVTPPALVLCADEDAAELLDDAPPPPLAVEELVPSPLEQAAVAAIMHASKAAREQGEAAFIIGDDSRTKYAASARIVSFALSPCDARSAPRTWEPGPGSSGPESC